MVACLGIQLFWVGNGRAEERERIHLAYAAGAECPNRSAFVARFLAHSRHVELVDEAAPTLLDIRVGVTNRGAWGELRFGDANGGGLARRVSGVDCAEVIAGLVLIAAVAVEPKAEVTPMQSDPAPVALDPLGDGAPSRSSASGPPATPYPQPAVDPHPRPGDSMVSSSLRRSAQNFPRRSAVVLSAAPGVGVEVRTPEAPAPSLGFTLGTRVGIEGAWHPALGLVLGLSMSPQVEAGAGEAHFTLFYGRFEAWPHLIHLGRFELGPVVGLEFGRLKGWGQSEHGELAEASAVTPWWALTQLVSLGYRAGWGFTVAARAGVIEPLRRDYFYVDRPRHDVHHIPYLGAVGGLVVSCRFE